MYGEEKRHENITIRATAGNTATEALMARMEDRSLSLIVF